MLNFHLNGLLTPHHNIKSNLVELEDTFLIKIPSGRRGELFEKYLFYTNSLKTLCQNSTLTQWIDGSFVTKKHEPGDIDLVTFVDFSTTEKLKNGLDDYRYPLSESIFGIDGYIVDV